MNQTPNSSRILVHRARKNIRAFLCKNCSLFDENNRCHCENLISFSLNQGWIEKFKPTVPPEVIAGELKTFKSEVILYKTISGKKESDGLRMKIAGLIEAQKLTILSKQKVK